MRPNVPGSRIAVVVTVAVVAAGGVAVSSGSGSAVPGKAAARSHEEIAASLLDHQRDRFSTQAVTRALQFTAGRALEPGRRAEADRTEVRSAAAGAAALPRAGLRNIRVNNPAADRFQVDQTTQSETTIAVSGKSVAVGFNDSQQALLALTDGLDMTGYAYSTNRGASFTDGGTLPNTMNFVNFGDPWLASDRAGRMYFATLAYGGNVGNLEVGVARSTNGGRTWTAPALVSPNQDALFYNGDKEAVTVGRDPKVATRDNIYVAWDDVVADPTSGSGFNGLPVARSTDHGVSWSMSYANKIPQAPDGCSFSQYIGAQPFVDPAGGALYVVAEKIVVDDPQCTGTVEGRRSEVIFRSTNGGVTFGPERTIATVTPSFASGLMELGPGKLVRNLEFPTIGIRSGRIYVAWNDGASGRSHLRLAVSDNAGATWSISAVTRGGLDELQPALSVDRRGLHVAYYQRNANNTLDLAVADSLDAGIHFTTRAVTSRSFPGVTTVPQFDPQIAFGYMGDYVAQVSDGTHQYFAWGDNRRRLRNFTHPRGRNDPDVFFARR
jgi:hypothetical protein